MITNHYEPRPGMGYGWNGNGMEWMEYAHYIFLLEFGPPTHSKFNI